MSSQEEAQKGSSMSKFSRGLVAVGSLVALIGMSPAKAATQLPLTICAPDLIFTADHINNPYSPFLPGQVARFHGVEEDEGVEVPLGLVVTVLDEEKTLYSGKQKIVTRVVEEREWVDPANPGFFDVGEELIEVSRNYFAQVENGPRPGSVCYFGEDVKSYEDGRFHGDRSGSWRADQKGNAPGIFMPANPQRGETYQIESAPGVAMDQATISNSPPKTVPFGTYQDVIRVQECGLDGACDTKFYASGPGLIIDEALELTDFDAGN
jgi:hypothetical protein